MNLIRLSISALFALMITFGMFLFMYELISLGGDKHGERDPISGIHFGPVDFPDDIAIRSRIKPKKPPPPNDPPPPPKMKLANREAQLPAMPQMDMPELDVPLTGGAGLFLGNFQQVDPSAEGDIIPVVVIRPMYPREAALNGTQGWVKVEFTITAVGSVKDARVVDSEPARIFDRSALRAILKWKFKPRVIDGVAVERQATQVIDFTLDDA